MKLTQTDPYGFPRIPLYQAVNLVTSMYGRTKRHRFPSDTDVWQAMGYRSKHGVATKSIAALKRYELLLPKASSFELSATALRLVEAPPQSLQRLQALFETATTPLIFRQLYRRWGKTDELDEHKVGQWLIETMSLKQTKAQEMASIFRANQTYLENETPTSLTKGHLRSPIDEGMLREVEPSEAILESINGVQEAHLRLDFGDFYGEIRLVGNMTQANVDLLVAALKVKTSSQVPSLPSDSQSDTRASLPVSEP